MKTYLGDGVYLSDDGYHLWLAVNHHENRVVALEPAVCLALLREMKRTVPIASLLKTVMEMNDEKA